MDISQSGTGKALLLAAIAIVAALVLYAVSGTRADRGRARPRCSSAPLLRWNPPGSGPPREIPSAYLLVEPEASGARQHGILLASHWIAADGSIVDTIPGDITWPEPADILGPVVLRLETPATPGRVDLRIFDEGADASGQPLGPGRRVVCEPDAGTIQGCRWVRRGDEIQVVWPAQNSRNSLLLVLYAEWYIPLAQRPAAAESNPIVSASWGFHVAYERPEAR